MKPRSNNGIRPLDSAYHSFITEHPSSATAPQLELRLDAARDNAGQPSRQSNSSRQRRRTRAQWWFQRMRQIVDRACDWSAAQPPRPEQIWFPNTHRQPTANPFLVSEERQVCE